MKYQIIVSAVNRSGKKDATGAFIPCAEAHAQFLRERGHEVTVSKFDLVNGVVKSNDFLEVDAVVFYGHGTSRGLQTGHYGGAGMARLARQLNAKGVKQLALYACSFMGGAAVNTFMRLWEGDRLFGHTTAGHCAFNPFVAWKTRNEDGVVVDDYVIADVRQTPGKLRKSLRAKLIIGVLPFAELPDKNSSWVTDYIFSPEV